MKEAPRRFVHVEEATRRFGRAAVERGADLLRQGDPLADDLVVAFERLPPGAGSRMLEQALRGGIESVEDAPEELVALFRELDHVPYWVDDDALERGGELLFRSGWFGGLALGASLLYGYGSAGGNKPLVFSGRLEAQTPRRLIATSRFVEATCVPGGLRRFSEGFAVTAHVRIMHAKVRRLILTSGRWSADDWGIPANQHDMGATSLLFSAVVVDSLEKLGFDLQPEEVHLFMQLWRYSGYLMGVDPEILPTSEREARRLIDFIATTEGEPDDDSRKLAHAYFSAGDNPLRATEAEKRRARRIVRIHQGITRGVLGETLSDQLGVPKHGLRHLYPMVRATVRRLEATRHALPRPLRALMHASAVRQGRAFWAMLTRAAASPITFAPPDSLMGLPLASQEIRATKQPRPRVKASPRAR